MSKANLSTLSTYPERLFAPSRRGGATIPLLVGVALLAIIGVGLLFFFNRNATASTNDSKTPEWAEVTRQTIPVKVSATGTLVARDQIDINSIIEHRDDPVVESVIPEGTWVKEGDWLVTLSAPSIISERDEAEARVLEQQAEVTEARRNLAIQEDELASEESKAILDVELAQLAFSEWEQGTVPQKELTLQLALETAERELEQAERELELSQALFEQKFISRTELEQDEITLIEAKNALETAKLSITVYRDYQKVMEQKEMLSDIEQAESALERTRRKNQNQIELYQARIDNEINELDQRKLRLERYQRMCDAITLHAPREGLVIYGSTIGSGWDRRSPIRQGARIWGGRRIMVISDTTHLLARVNVHESKIRDVKPGQSVVVELVARPGLQLQGEVVSKSNSANTDSAANPNLAEYTVVVSLPPNNEGEDLKPGMSCSAEIFIRNIPDALSLPIQAIHTEGKEHFVYVPATAGKVKRQSVEVGGSSETQVEIVSGLEQGTKVLMRSPRPGEVLQPKPGSNTVTAMN